jgi:pimeloyl-ACP methyl ester carboxylesterase
MIASMSWVEVAGTDIHYVEAGSGVPLVFLHGFGSCAEAWHRQLDAFGGRFRVIAYDSVNHGHSSNSPVGEPEPDRADELEAFLDELGIDGPILAGNSMGALTLLRWATRHPARARALVPSGMGVGESQAAAAVRRNLFEPVGDDVLFLPGESGFTEGFPTERPREYERYMRLRSTATRIEAARRPREFTMRGPSRDELADRVASIKSPMQIVVGERDFLRESAANLHRLVKHSRLAVVPGGPHNLYWEKPAEYDRIVGEFLDEID